MPYPSPSRVATALTCQQTITRPPLPPPNMGISFETKNKIQKKDLVSLAEEMKNRKISPPCYEIAKMYSTKAAFFNNLG